MSYYDPPDIEESDIVKELANINVFIKAIKDVCRTYKMFMIFNSNFINSEVVGGKVKLSIDEISIKFSTNRDSLSYLGTYEIPYEIPAEDIVSALNNYNDFIKEVLDVADKHGMKGNVERHDVVVSYSHESINEKPPSFDFRYVLMEFRFKDQDERYDDHCYC